MRAMTSYRPKLAFLFLALFCFGSPCFAEAPVLPKRPLVLVDPDGNEIQTYCVVPLYIKTSDSSTGEGWDIERRLFLKWPTSIRNDDGISKIRMQDAQMHVTSILGLAIWLQPKGEGITWTRLLFLKRGYRPTLWVGSFDPRFTKDILVERGESESVVELLLAKTRDTEKLRDLYKLQGMERTWEIVDEYSEEDRKELKKCYFENGNSGSDHE